MIVSCSLPSPTNDILFSSSLLESLLLILADFISDKKNKNSYIIVDHGNEYRNELRTLFDNEILGRLGEEVQYEVNRNKVEQLKDLLMNNIKTMFIPYDNLDELFKYLNEQYDVIFDKSLQESGEGNVVYFSSEINSVENVQNLGKLKTFEYRFLRKIREK